MGDGQHHGGPAHILLHRRHAGSGFQIIAAGVENDAFADQRHLGCDLSAPGQIDQARRARRAHAHRMDQRIILFQQRFADDLRKLRLVTLRQFARGGCELLRTQIVGRGVDEIARQENAIDDTADLCSVDTLGQNQTRRRARLGAITIEAIGAERPAKRRKRRIDPVGQRPVAVHALRQTLAEQSQRQGIARFA